MRLLGPTNVDVDGASFEVPHNDPYRDYSYAIFVWGTSIGGGTVTIQVSPDGVNWFTARTHSDTQVVFTVFDHVMARIRGKFMRARFTGSAGASAVVVDLY